MEEKSPRLYRRFTSVTMDLVIEHAKSDPFSSLASLPIKPHAPAARGGILRHLEHVRAQTEGLEYPVPEFLQFAHHLVDFLLLGGLDARGERGQHLRHGPSVRGWEDGEVFGRAEGLVVRERGREVGPVRLVGQGVLVRGSRREWVGFRLVRRGGAIAGGEIVCFEVGRR